MAGIRFFWGQPCDLAPVREHDRIRPRHEQGFGAACRRRREGAIELAGPGRLDGYELQVKGTGCALRLLVVQDTAPEVNGKSWAELTEEEHQRMPHDYEAQVGQGAITLHSEERLAASDRGVVMLRRLLRREIEAVQAGRDPLGVIFDRARAVVQVEAGNFILEPAG